MTDPTLLRGRPLADRLQSTVEEDVATLRDHGVVPTLGTVLMTDDATQRRFMELKHDRCRSLGIETRRVDVDPDAPASALYDAVTGLAEDDEVTAVFVQDPLPDHVDEQRMRALVPPEKDVDCLAHENLGRLVAGRPRVVPATAGAVRHLLDAHDVETAGAEVVVVGRTTTIGKPLANLLLARGDGGDATVTVCHTATTDLAAHTRRADVLVTAAGVPRLVDGAMLDDGVVVVDVSATRVNADGTPADGSDPATEGELVGDVDFESAAAKASAITPVPGGVGPLTLAMIGRNVVDVAAAGADRSGLLETR